MSGVDVSDLKNISIIYEPQFNIMLKWVVIYYLFMIMHSVIIY